MPAHRRLFRFKLLLTLSLTCSCVNAGPLQSPSSSSTPANSQIKLLSTGEIEQVRESGLIEANNRFGWKLFDQFYKAEPGANHFISPVSAAIALQMTLQGADGETLSQMKQALGLTALDNQTLLANMPLLLRKLQRPSADVSLEIANSIWMGKTYNFEADFLKAIQGPFAASATNVDFAAADTPQKINSWAARTTHGKIAKVVEKIKDPQTVFYLLNAIYFKGDWTDPFEKAETSQKAFRLEGGKAKQVPMMRRFGTFQYRSPNESFPHQAVALPYGKEGKLKMYLFLPTEGKTLADLQADLQTQDFESLAANFQREGGSLQMPRFKLEWKRSLIDPLKALGMVDAFSELKAEFPKLTEPDAGTYISEADQFSYVDVNETGTEAAAVTVVVGVPASSEPMKTMDMLVDHPFAFVIRDEETRQILFMGSIADPAPDSPAVPG